MSRRDDRIAREAQRAYETKYGPRPRELARVTSRVDGLEVRVTVVAGAVKEPALIGVMWNDAVLRTLRTPAVVERYVRELAFDGVLVPLLAHGAHARRTARGPRYRMAAAVALECLRAERVYIDASDAPTRRVGPLLDVTLDLGPRARQEPPSHDAWRALAQAVINHGAGMPCAHSARVVSLDAYRGAR